MLRGLLLRPLAPALAPLSARFYAVIPGRTRKAIRKSNAAAQRELLAFARAFDPLRTARVQLSQTLRYLGWDACPAETVGEGLVVDFTLLEWFVAFDVVPGSAYVLPGGAAASNDCGWGPGLFPELNPPPVLGRSRTQPRAGELGYFPCAPLAETGAGGGEGPEEGGGGGGGPQMAPEALAALLRSGARGPPPLLALGSAPPPPARRVTTPAETLFTSAPPSWLDPVRGLVLDAPTAARHAAIRARGWKLVAVPEPLWNFAATKRHDAHYARRDLLLSKVLPIAPFQERPLEMVNRLRQRINEKTKPLHAAERAAAQIHEAKVKTGELMERLRAEGGGGGGGGGGGAEAEVAATAAAAAGAPQSAPAAFQQTLTMQRVRPEKTASRQSRAQGRQREADSEAAGARGE